MSRAAVADPPRAGESDADTRIRHGDHHGGRWNGAWAGGGQIAAGSAAVHSDKEDVVTQKTLLRARQLYPRKGPEFFVIRGRVGSACMSADDMACLVGWGLSRR